MSYSGTPSPSKQALSPVMLPAFFRQDPSRRPCFQDVVEELEAELGSVESLTEL